MMPHPTTQTVDDILIETTKKLEDKYPGFKGRVYFDDSRAWSLFVYGDRLNLPVLKFGAFRDYNGGGEKGPIQHNGREEENTVELGEYFAKQLEKIEDIIAHTDTNLVGPEALSEKKSLKEEFEVDTLAIADFIEEAVNTTTDILQTTPRDAWDTYTRVLDEDFSLVVYFEEGFDPSDTCYILHPESKRGDALVAAIKLRDDSGTDGDMMLFPYDEESGECYTYSYPIDKEFTHENYIRLARDLISDYRHVRNIYDEKEYANERTNEVEDDDDDYDWCGWCHEYTPNSDMSWIGKLYVCSHCRCCCCHIKSF